MGNHTSLQKQQKMFQMFDAPVAVDGHALLLVQNMNAKP
jgi:hypothetical protein